MKPLVVFEIVSRRGGSSTSAASGGISNGLQFPMASIDWWLAKISRAEIPPIFWRAANR